jgi:cytoskeletal protein CcmA (bactofilin family)
MAIVQISKIQVRSGNIADLPQLSPGEFGWASDDHRLFIGNDPNVLGPTPDNTEILTDVSKLAAGNTTEVQFNNLGDLAGSNLFTFNSDSGNLNLGGNLLPQSNVTFDLGSNALRWKDLYLAGNTITIGNSFIKGLANTAIRVPNLVVDGGLFANTANLTGDVNIAGNLIVEGNVTSIHVDTLNVQDPIIELGGGPNGTPLTFNDGKDRGMLLKHFTTTPISAFVGLDVSANQFIIASDVTMSSDVITVNTYGNLRLSNLISNGISVVGNVSVTGNINTTGNLTTTGNISSNNLSTVNITATGNISVYGNISATNLDIVDDVTTDSFAANSAVISSMILGSLTTTSLTTGSTSTAGTITGNWSLTPGSQLRSSYADLAEHYRSDKSYPVGTVMAVGGSKEVTIATQAHVGKIAGIISSEPAYVMNSGIDDGSSVPIALAGRVPCKVIGKITKGDMMTISSTPGVATNTDTVIPGAMLGTALGDFEQDGVGYLEVMVNRF